METSASWKSLTLPAAHVDSPTIEVPLPSGLFTTSITLETGMPCEFYNLWSLLNLVTFLAPSSSSPSCNWS